MVRPRFGRLSVAQQNAILHAAVREFAAHGYADASLNRIIEAAGISKGSMYYYFDGKEDLYAHIIRDRLEDLLERAGPFEIPASRGADAFWSALEASYLRLMRMLEESPDLAALLRDWLTGQASPRLSEAQHEAEESALPWLTRTLAAGQQAGAVRTDVPGDLLIAIAMGVGQAMDTWLITQPAAGADLAGAVHTLFGMLRRALGP